MPFTTYVDESGNKHDKTVLCLGGLLSSVSQWSEMEREWNETLLDSPMPRYEDGRPQPFHMTDFEANAGVFDKKHGWTEEGKTTLFDRLLGIMVRRVKMRVYTMLSLGDYRAQISHADPELKRAYTFAALGVASRIGHWARSAANAENVPYVFEKAKGVDQGRAMRAIDDLRRGDAGNVFQIGETISADKVLPPLQAADIWSWEVRRYFHNQFSGGSPYPLRRSLARVCEVPDGKGFILTGDNLQKLISGWKQSIESGEHIGEIPIEPRSLSLNDRPRIVLNGGERSLL